MRRITFEVPTEIIGDFAEKLAEMEIENSITGTTEEGAIEVEVVYERDENSLIDELETYLEGLKETLGETEEDED